MKYKNATFILKLRIIGHEAFGASKVYDSCSRIVLSEGKGNIRLLNLRKM